MTTLPLDPASIPTSPTFASPQSPRNATLDELAARHGTDKRVGIHAYTKWYEALLSPLRWQPINFLEIGVQNGYSIKMWADYFPNAKLVGIDIDPFCAKFATDRIQIITGSQDNPAITKYLPVSSARSTSSSTTAAMSVNTSAPASTCSFRS